MTNEQVSLLNGPTLHTQSVYFYLHIIPLCGRACLVSLVDVSFTQSGTVCGRAGDMVLYILQQCQTGLLAAEVPGRGVKSPAALSVTAPTPSPQPLVDGPGRDEDGQVGQGQLPAGSNCLPCPAVTLIAAPPRSLSGTPGKCRSVGVGAHHNKPVSKSSGISPSSFKCRRFFLPFAVR